LDLITARADGTHRRKVVSNVRNPVWSPNGKLLAFDRDHGETGNNPTSTIYTIRPDGTHLRRLFTDHPGAGNEGFSNGLDWQPLPR